MQRRDFLRSAAIAAAAFGIPVARAEQAFSMDAPSLPSDNLFLSDPEKYWTELRRQWLLAPDRINLNCGSDWMHSAACFARGDRAHAGG